MVEVCEVGLGGEGVGMVRSAQSRRDIGVFLRLVAVIAGLPRGKVRGGQVTRVVEV